MASRTEASPTAQHQDDQGERPLRRGDLVRVSEEGKRAERRLNDRYGDALGRICAVDEENDSYSVEWIVLGGTTTRLRRQYLFHTTAQSEGMTEASGQANKRKRRPPPMEPTLFTAADVAKKKVKRAATAASKKKAPATAGKKKAATKKQPAKKASSDLSAADTDANATAPGEPQAAGADVKPSATAANKKAGGKRKQSAGSNKQRKANNKKAPANATSEEGASAKPTPKTKSAAKAKASAGGAKTAKGKAGASAKASKGCAEKPLVEQAEAAAGAYSMSLYEKHRREFERMVTRLEKIDKLGWFWDEAPPEYDENYDDTTTDSNNEAVRFPAHAPHSWEMIRRRRLAGRYVQDRECLEEQERFGLLQPYYDWRGKWPKARYSGSAASKKKKPPPTNNNTTSAASANRRVKHPQGVHWDVFYSDVMAMIDAAVERNRARNGDNREEDIADAATINTTTTDGSVADSSAAEQPRNANELDRRGVLFAANKVREAVVAAVDKTGRRHDRELRSSDDIYKFSLALDKHVNGEAAMQKEWRRQPFPERQYERLQGKDTVCAGLSLVDERIASHELLTKLEDKFIGVSYRYDDDTGQSEAWMKSVLDETEMRASSNHNVSEKRQKQRAAALAMAGDEGVTRAQVTATMNALLMGVEDRVMTRKGVLSQPELRSANWGNSRLDAEPPQIVEQPVWGLDCYTRRNISICLETELDAETALTFIEKWLLPAVNACPPELAHDLANATRLLEGLPFEQANTGEEEEAGDKPSSEDRSTQQPPAQWSHTILGDALRKKIETSAPPWIPAAAQLLFRATQALGPDFFRVHPKGHGSVLLTSQTVPPNTLITFYRGEIYPLWRWCEKMDAIDLTQRRKHLKPALPDFYNMTMERPQTDPRGYGTLIVDASRKAGYGSSLSHSCDPTCEVRVAAKHGELCLAMTTLRAMEMGQELTFHYNASTDSLQEYRSAVCLCGHGACRGSFLHFGTADCYQQVLNRNAPIASRLANLIKGGTKRVVSSDDAKILSRHGFRTAAFGATAVNRHLGASVLSDTLDIVPVWLQTYVADVLRYIEYERRALPIALICDKTSKGEEGQQASNEVEKHDDEVFAPPENGFSFFVKNQADILLDLVQKEMESSEKKKTKDEIAHETRRLGANLWRALSSEKKQRWHDAARAEYLQQKKRKQDGDSRDDKKKGKKKSKEKMAADDNIESLISSEFEFQEADAEGIAAMGLRVQQLTAALSRVGRVLDRHREGHLVELQEQERAMAAATGSNEATAKAKSYDTQTLRDAIHPPVSVLSDEEVVDWMWNRSDGIVNSLLRKAEVARCVRPSLVQGIYKIRQDYARLSQIGEDASPKSNASSVLSNGCSARQLLNEALLELRSLVMAELYGMAKDFRHRNKPAPASSRKQTKGQGDGDETNEKEDKAEDDMQDDTPSAVGVGPEEKKEEAGDSCMPISQTLDAGQKKEDDDKTTQGHHIEVEQVMESLLGAVERRLAEGSATKKIRFVDRSAEKEDEPWIAHYSDRFMLQASADVLLLYAHTQNFFSLNPYASLESSPIEIYARELGNNVPRSVIDTEVTYAADGEQEDGKAKRKIATLTSPVKPVSKSATSRQKRQQDSEKDDEDDDKNFCSPEDVVAEVKVSYQGDYILSQLLQWYNGGMGGSSGGGLPHMAGAVQLPDIAACWSSKLSEKKRSRILTRTLYESKVRPQLVEWMQDPYQRGDAWPPEVDQAFAFREGAKPDRRRGNPADSDDEEDSEFYSNIRFGSPVLDFLVSGDESGIFNVLEELDSDNKVAAKDGGDDGMFASVDKGRPAQAVCRWVQCESCLKWRKIPWHVDIDLLPEHFFCKDNQWDANQNSCDAPEEDWDHDDKLVDGQGKMENSPLVRQDTSPSKEASFYVGAKFDVMRTLRGAEKFTPATVTHVDFSGSVKRIKFHFSKTSSDADEWISFGSRRIAPWRSKTSPPQPASKRKLLDGDKAASKKAKTNGNNKHDRKGAKTENDEASRANGGDSEPALKKATGRPRKEKFTDPSDARSFVPAARFDVYRTLKNGSGEKWVVAAVADFDATTQRIRFHYRKSRPEDDDWFELGSPRIAALHTHTEPYKTKKRMLEQQQLQQASGDAQPSSLPSSSGGADLASSLAMLSHHAAQREEARELPKYGPVEYPPASADAVASSSAIVPTSVGTTSKVEPAKTAAGNEHENLGKPTSSSAKVPVDGSEGSHAKDNSSPTSTARGVTSDAEANVLGCLMMLAASASKVTVEGSSGSAPQEQSQAATPARPLPPSPSAQEQQKEEQQQKLDELQQAQLRRQHQEQLQQQQLQRDQAQAQQLQIEQAQLQREQQRHQQQMEAQQLHREHAQREQAQQYQREQQQRQQHELAYLQYAAAAAQHPQAHQPPPHLQGSGARSLAGVLNTFGHPQQQPPPPQQAYHQQQPPAFAQQPHPHPHHNPTYHTQQQQLIAAAISNAKKGNDSAGGTYGGLAPATAPGAPQQQQQQRAAQQQQHLFAGMPHPSADNNAAAAVAAGVARLLTLSRQSNNGAGNSSNNNNGLARQHPPQF